MPDPDRFERLRAEPASVRKRVFRRCTVPLHALLLLCVVVSAAPGQEARPLWWADMQAEAQAHGYHLLETDVATVGPEFLVLDVRPDYEFRGGHVAGAHNVEFPPTDAAGDAQAIAAALAEVVALAEGTMDRPVAVYCRSFR